MQLFVDVGNTRIKWGYWNGHDLIDVNAAVHRGLNFDRLLHTIWGDMTPPKKVWVANVVDEEIQEALEAWMHTVWDRAPIFLKTEPEAFGVTNGYLEPKTLGLDRWLAMIAGFHAFEATHPVCILDFGTCLTADVVTQSGQHLGGLILPGLQSMRQTLASSAKGCVLASKQNQPFQSEGFFGKNTQDGIFGGTLYACVAYVERLLNDVDREFNGEVKTIVTGGDAKMFMNLINHEVLYKPNLVLEGISFYANSSPGLAKKQKATSEEIELMD